MEFTTYTLCILLFFAGIVWDHARTEIVNLICGSISSSGCFKEFCRGGKKLRGRMNYLHAKKQKTKMNKIMSAEQTMVVVGSGPVIVLHICIASLSIN